MNKRNRILKIASLVTISSLLIITGCGNTSSESETCDPMIGCLTTGEEEKNPYLEHLNLVDESANFSYSLDSSVSNETGSANYEIFVRSFYDSDGDGTGDINGVTEKLNYLSDLGIKNLWLMPINPSPSYHGYDITDYYGIESDYGTLEDFENLLGEAKKFNIGIYMDLVLNHSSSRHPFFEQSYQDYVDDNNSSDSKKDWYNWSETSKNGYTSKGSYYYESLFSSDMPDLNLDNEGVRTEVDNIVKYWIEKGVAGFRLDAVTYYYNQDVTKNNQFLTFLKTTANKYNPNVQFVGEAWIGSTNGLLNYTRSQCDSFFAFPNSSAVSGNDSINVLANGNGNTVNYTTNISKYINDIKANNENGYASFFIDNHDINRYSPDDNKLKTAFSLLELLPGDSYLYYGSEISLMGKRGNENTDALRRLPMIWDKNDKTGETSFPDFNNLNLSYSQVDLGVNDQLNITDSPLNHLKKAINLRNKYSFIHDSSMISLTNNVISYEENVVIYKLLSKDTKDYIIVVTNVGDNDTVIKFDGIGNSIVDSIDTAKKKPTLIDNYLSIGAHSSVILK